MPFGRTANQKPSTDTSTKRTFDSPFLSLTGERIVRIVGDEVQVKRHFWRGVNIGDGKTGEKPIVVARSEVDDSGETVFLGYDKAPDYWNNPIDEMYRSEYTKEEITTGGKYPQTRFYVNVFDRTPVFRTDDGIFYPEMYLTKDGDIKSEYVHLGEPIPHNKIMILEQSSGKPTGDHFYNKIIAAAKSLKSRQGKKITIEQCDLRITYDLSSGRKWNGKPVPDRNVHPDINQEHLAYKDEDLYDLYSWLAPWPNVAIQDILEGKVYADVVKEHNIKLFPVKNGSDDLPF